MPVVVRSALHLAPGPASLYVVWGAGAPPHTYTGRAGKPSATRIIDEAHEPHHDRPVDNSHPHPNRMLYLQSKVPCTTAKTRNGDYGNPY